jgi:hypothetical protein
VTVSLPIPEHASKKVTTATMPPTAPPLVTANDLLWDVSNPPPQERSETDWDGCTGEAAITEDDVGEDISVWSK